VRDEERRGLVAKWMRDAGNQWLTTDHTPVPGSDFSVDDVVPYKVSPIVCFGVTTAIDHLGSVVDAMMSGKPMRQYAHFTTLRTSLLASARVRWILEADSSVERQLHRLKFRLQNTDEQRKATRGFAGSPLEPATEQSRLDAIASWTLKSHHSRHGPMSSARLSSSHRRTQYRCCVITWSTPTHGRVQQS
jgi:hypothetical protein